MLDRSALRMDGTTVANFSPNRLMLIAVLLAGALAYAGARTGTDMIGLERMTPGSPPAGFSFAQTGQGYPGQWSVTDDTTAASRRTIEQISTARSDHRFPLAIYNALEAVNVDVRVNFRAVGGWIDQAAGIAVRLRDADNYYVARANALEDNVRFYRVVRGRREQLASASLKVTGEVWHSLGLRAQGNRFTISYDDKVLFVAIDDTFDTAGKVALWTKADSITRFDQIEVTPLP
jgi:hypothetical protein